MCPQEHFRQTDQTMGYGLIGAGAFGRYCCAQYRQLPNVKLVAVADAKPQVAEAAAAQFNMHACCSVDELLARDDVQLVHIATPPTTHKDLAIRAIEAGKHILCEKPLATNLDDARQMIDLSAAQGTMLSVNLIMRYNPLCAAVKQIVDERLLGLPLHGFFENYAKDEELGPDHWFWDRKLSGGIFIEHGVHFFDLFAWWFGDGRIESAQQVVRPDTGGTGGSDDIIEQVQCTVRYGQSTLVNFYHGFTQAQRMDRQEMRLVFERGSLSLFDWVPTRLEIDCLADRATISKLEQLLPGVTVDCLEPYHAEQRKVYSRHKHYEVDGRYRVRADVMMDKPALYSHVLRGLLSDQIQAANDPSHQRQVTEANGISSLSLAVGADNLARAGSKLG